ncbi:MAG: KpsF/GutQ family sugar-phosphate isomerase [Pirellulales bacterium]
MDEKKYVADPTFPGILARGKAVLESEGDAILRLANQLDGAFERAVDTVLTCSGNLIVTGIGKAGLIAKKISATLASTGTPSHFLHPAEAMHGDLGVIRGDDVVLAFSQSGETEEMVRLLPHLKSRKVPIVAITARAHSTLGRNASVVLKIGEVQEACEHHLAPSTSTALMLAIGDALSLVVSSQRNFQPEDFAARHPGGSLGRQLLCVEEAMRSFSQCRIALPEESVRTVFSKPLPRRRTGAVMVIDDQGILRGIFTDSDLARLFERHEDAAIDGPIQAVMTQQPVTIRVGSRVSDAVAILDEHHISELPIVDSDGRLIGLLDIVDLVCSDPAEQPVTITKNSQTAA